MQQETMALPSQADAQRALDLKMHHANLVEGMRAGRVTPDQIGAWFWGLSDDDVNLLVRGRRATGGD